MKKNKRSPGRSRRKRRLIIIIFFIFAFFVLPFSLLATVPQQQFYPVKGTVTDTRGVPLPGVTIRYGQIGATTGNDGSFAFRLPETKGWLTFSSVGYKTVTLNYQSGIHLKVRMQEELTALDEVQVIAYGEQSKREIVGSMGTVKASSLKDNATSDLINKLQGQIAGVQIVNPSGAPGGQGSITIRGFNSLSVEPARIGSDPLWVIDGVPLYTISERHSGINPLSGISTNDIERIDVLKDAASCAMYGSRAANGVVIITTKQGRFNEKFSVTASIIQSFSFMTNLPTLTTGNKERQFRLEALRNFQEAFYNPETNTYQYVNSPEESVQQGLHYDYFWNQGAGARFPIYQDSLNPFYNNATNLFRYYFRTARVTDASLRFTGGSQAIAYNIGIGYYTEKGALRNTGFNRINLLGNINFKPYTKLEGRINFALTRTGISQSNNQIDQYNLQKFTTGVPEIPDFLLSTSTLLPGQGTPAFEELTRRFEESKEANDSYRFRTIFQLGYKPVPALEIKTNFSFDYLGIHRNTFLPSSVDDYKQTYSGGQDIRNLSALNENMILYDKWLNDKHHFKFIGGISFQFDQNNSISGYGRGEIDKIHYVTFFTQVIDPVTKRQIKEYNSDMSKSTLVSLFARIGYNYRNKYLIEATFRRDGSSRFGKNTRWGSFPSVATGYAFSEENFMQGMKDVISYGKIRCSYGKTGKQFESPYLAQGVYGPGSITFQGKPTMTIVDLPNSDLTWEETDQYDIGIDLDLLNYRINLTADYYYRYTDKLLYCISLAGNYSGFRQQWQNAYAISNQGIEISLKADVFRNDKIKWNIHFNLARNWNRLEKSQENRSFWNPYSGDNISVMGKALNGLYVFHDQGFYKNQDEVPYVYMNGKKTYLGSRNQYYRPGDRIILDTDKNGMISVIPPNQEDRIYAGSPLPTISGGIISSLLWKGFDLNVTLPYTLGRHVLYKGGGSLLTTDKAAPILLDLNKQTFWSETNPNTSYPVNRMATNLNNFASNLLSNVYKVNFIKLKLISLGYTLPEPIQKKLGFETRIFISGENIFTWSNYPGPDPESIDPVTGVDNFNNYPLSRKITFGLTLKF